MKKHVTIMLASLLAILVIDFTSFAAQKVIVYTSVDQLFSEPILRGFEKKTGIKVKAVYDVEASKTTGLVNRLIAERKNPKCDVFWNSEFAQTIVLKNKGLLEPYLSPSANDIPHTFRDQEHYWSGFGARARVLIYNTRALSERDLPRSIFDLTKENWKGRFALGYPLFGTTATHVAALYVAFGKDKAERYLKELKANGVVIVDGNSVARDMVVEGDLPLAFTDTDDVNVAVQAGRPVKMYFPDADSFGTLFIPNTVSLIKGAPHPETARTFIDYLLNRETESLLAYSESAQIPVRSGVKKPAHVPDISSITSMQVDYNKVAGKMQEAARFSQDLFIR